MANAVPLKKKKIAWTLMEQIDRLNARWHLNFSGVELNLIRKALAAYADGKGAGDRET